MQHVLSLTLQFIRPGFLSTPNKLFCVIRNRTLSSRHITTSRDALGSHRFDMPNYSTIERGCRNTDNYRVYFETKHGVVSPFHDIPLYANDDKSVLNMVVEIPRWSNAKMEISKEDSMNPIKQDVKKGKLRYVANLFPYHGYIWNYGALPQTWEDPNYMEPDTKTMGDKDPLDVCEIGSTIHKTGAVIQVKVLGIMCLIDEGETDWKVIVIDVNDPRAGELHDVDDVKTHCPGLLEATYNWFRLYKVPDGKDENTFAFEGKAKDREYAMKVVGEAHRQWQSLLQNKVSDDDLSCHNTCVISSPYRITSSEANDIVSKAPEQGVTEPLSPTVNQIHYVHPTAPRE